MTRIFKATAFVSLFFTFILIFPNSATAQSENKNVVQLRIQTSMSFSNTLPTDELLELTEKLQTVSYLQHIDSSVNSRRRGNMEENRLQVNANLEFSNFNEYKNWFTDPATEALINSFFEKSEQFSMNLRIDKRE